MKKHFDPPFEGSDSRCFDSIPTVRAFGTFPLFLRSVVLLLSFSVSLCVGVSLSVVSVGGSLQKVRDKDDTGTLMEG